MLVTRRRGASVVAEGATNRTLSRRVPKHLSANRTNSQFGDPLNYLLGPDRGVVFMLNERRAGRLFSYFTIVV